MDVRAGVADRHRLTAGMEDYLKVIFHLAQSQSPVSNQMLSEHLEVNPTSVSGMLKRLAEFEVVRYEPYRGVTLTEEGQQMAVSIVRRHRLIEQLLVEKLDLPWDQVHEIAEVWEHTLSDAVEQHIDGLLGHPAADPHGAPIPTREGRLPQRDQVRLSTLVVGEGGVISEVSDHDPVLLRYLEGRALRPGTVLEVVDMAPVDGTMTVRVAKSEQVVGLQAAEHIFLADGQEMR